MIDILTIDLIPVLSLRTRGTVLNRYCSKLGSVNVVLGQAMNNGVEFSEINVKKKLKN